VVYVDKVSLALYDDAVRLLLGCGYVVSSNGHGCLIEHRTDGDDVSHCYNLAQLVDLADLFEWHDQRRIEKSPKARRPEGVNQCEGISAR